MTKFNKKRKVFQEFGFVSDLIKESKIKIFIISTIVLIAFLTGIIVAIKTKVNYDNLNNLGVVCFKKGGIINTSFFTRFLSMLLIILICFGCSFSKYLFPIASLFLAYRGYLLGVNICLIFAINGIGGIITSLLIIFPCQIIALVLLTLFYILMCKTQRDYCLFGSSRVSNQKLKLFLSVLIALLLICFIESILLAIFSPRVILVI